MRTRWQDWVIAICLVALGVTGIWTIWGQGIAELFHPTREAGEAATGPVGPAGTSGPAGTAPARTVPPPAGPAQGPF